MKAMPGSGTIPTGGHLMKTNVTLKIDTELLREAKILAARQGTSLSRMLSETLEEMVRGELAYERAKKRALARLRRGSDLQWHPAGSRDNLHARGKQR
jgi:hypothetical protein